MSQTNITDTSIKLNVTAEPDSQLERQLAKVSSLVEKSQVEANRRASKNMIAEMSRIGRDAQADTYANRALTGFNPSREAEGQEKLRRIMRHSLEDEAAEHRRRISESLGGYGRTSGGVGSTASKNINDSIQAEIEANKRMAQERLRDEQSFAEFKRKTIAENEGQEKLRRIMRFSWEDEAAEHRRKLSERLANPYGSASGGTGSTASKNINDSIQAEIEANKRMAQERLRDEQTFSEFKQKTIEDNAIRQRRLEESLHADRRRAMSTEQRINDDHEQRVVLIRREVTLSQQQTDELIRQSSLIRDQAMKRNAVTIEYERRNEALHAAGKNARLGPIFQEAGRGLEDFIVGFSMAKTNAEGLALGLRGAANNMGQLASFAGPMVGAYVAIGASLSTVIVPMMAKWVSQQFDTSRDIEKYKNELKEIAKLEGVRSKAKTEAANVEDLEQLEKKRKQALEERAVIEDKISALVKKQTEAHQELARAMADEAKFNKEQQNWYQAKGLRSVVRWMSGQSGQVAAAKPEAEAADEAVKKLQSEFNKTSELMRNMEEERDKLIARDMFKRNEARDKWNRQNDLDQWQQSNEFDAWVAEQKKRAAEKAIDDQIEAQQSKLEKLQDRQQSPNGPSGHAVFGSQTTASIINRAIAGSASVEDTLKAQLKVEKEQLKELQRQKKAMTIRI